MASTSEVGHNKNVANFNALCAIVTEMGSIYQPTNEHILLENMTPLQADLKVAVKSLNTKIPIFRNLIADRNALIAPLNKKCTRALNSFKALDVADEHKEKMSGLVKNIRGDKSKKINPETAEDDSISTSQQSYDNRIANFDTFIEQLKSHPEYIPNETDVKTTTLATYHTALQAINVQTNTAGYAVLTHRNNRNILLYTKQGNVFELQKTIKTYLKSLGEPAAHYYKAAVKLKFKNIQ